MTNVKIIRHRTCMCRCFVSFLLNVPVNVSVLQLKNLNLLLLVQYFNKGLSTLMNRCIYRLRKAEEVATQLRRKGVPAGEAAYIAKRRHNQE